MIQANWLDEISWLLELWANVTELISALVLIGLAGRPLKQKLLRNRGSHP